MPAKRFREQHVWVLGTSFIFPFLHQFSWHPNRSKIQTFLHFQQPNKKKKGTKHIKRKKTIEKMTRLNCQLTKSMHYKQNNQIEGEKNYFRLPLPVLRRRQRLCCFVFFF
ncbi:hypothetical protein ACB098_06G053800 [Castanea mollissima]